MNSRTRTKTVLLLAVSASVLAASCTRRARDGASTAPSAALNPSGPAFVAYDQIEPRAVLAATRPSTRPAPVEAVELFARARGAMLEGRRFSAVQLLERAAVIDGESAEVQALLAQAVVEAEGGAGEASLERAARALRRAGELRPDDLDTWLRLGRVEAARDRQADALGALRLAALTTEYRETPDRATLVDLHLARALQANGYDRAALERYDAVLRAVARMAETSGGSLREVPELALVAQRPEVLYVEVGALYERNGQFRDAARVLEAAAKRDEESFDTQARFVRALVKVGEFDRARTEAGRLVVRFRADTRSMALLDEVYRQSGQEGRAVDELRRLHEDRPGDRTILLALTEGLRRQGRTAEAEQVIDAVLKKNTATGGDGTVGNVELLRRLAELRAARGDVTGAARAIVLAAADAPDGAEAFGRALDELTRPTRDDRLRLRSLAGLDVGGAPRAVASRDFFAARLAISLANIPVAWRLLASSADAGFPPAVLLLAERALTEEDGPAKARAARLERAIAAARASNSPGLLLAVDGRRQLVSRDWIRASRTLADAVAAGQRDVRTQLLLSTSLSQAGQASLAEQVLTRVAADHRDDPAAQGRLVQWHAATGRSDLAVRVAAEWARSAPGSADARATEAQIAIQISRDTVAAERLAREILEQFPHDAEAIEVAGQVMKAVGKAGEWASAVAERFERSPRAMALLTSIVSGAVEGGRRGEAERAIVRMQAAAADDAELLYLASAVCHRAGLREAARECLMLALKADPTHAPAANDYAYEIADSSGLTPEQLPELERLARLAVAADESNAAFADTLGWVLYKRRQFAEAVTMLERAAALSEDRADATVLDQLGDAHWRAGARDAAVDAWRAAQAVLDRDAALTVELPEDKARRLRVRGKVERANRGEEPSVAPVP